MPSTKTAVVAITYATSSATFPEGSVVDHIVVSMTATATPANSPPVQSVAEGTASVTFGPLAPDTYTISAQAFPAVGPAWAPAATTTIVISAPVLISLSLPSSVSASQP